MSRRVRRLALGPCPSHEGSHVELVARRWPLRERDEIRAIGRSTDTLRVVDDDLGPDEWVAREHRCDRLDLPSRERRRPRARACATVARDGSTYHRSRATSASRRQRPRRAAASAPTTRRACSSTWGTTHGKSHASRPSHAGHAASTRTHRHAETERCGVASRPARSAPVPPRRPRRVAVRSRAHSTLSARRRIRASATRSSTRS